MLTEQRIIVKKVSDKIFVRHEQDQHVIVFILNKDAAMQLSGMLESAVKTRGEYEVGISI